MPLDFENNQTVDALVKSGAFVSAIAQKDLHTIKEKAPNNFLKIDDPLSFQTQVANGQLEKPLATVTFKIEIEDNIFAEYFVVTKKSTGPIIWLHFMRNNSVVIDTTHGLKQFPNLTMQVKTASSETTTKTTGSHHWRCLDDTTDDNKNNHSPCWPSVKMEHNRDCDTFVELYGNSKFADFPLKVNITDKRVAVKVTDTTKSPYLIKKNTQMQSSP